MGSVLKLRWENHCRELLHFEFASESYHINMYFHLFATLRPVLKNIQIYITVDLPQRQHCVQQIPKNANKYLIFLFVFEENLFVFRHEECIYIALCIHSLKEIKCLSTSPKNNVWHLACIFVFGLLCLRKAEDSLWTIGFQKGWAQCAPTRTTGLYSLASSCPLLTGEQMWRRKSVVWSEAKEGQVRSSFLHLLATHAEPPTTWFNPQRTDFKAMDQ